MPNELYLAAFMTIAYMKVNVVLYCMLSYICRLDNLTVPLDAIVKLDIRPSWSIHHSVEDLMNEIKFNSISESI